MIENTEILRHWPLATDPRKTQLDVLDWVSKLPSNIKNILLEVPVGGGKSPLAMNLSGWYSETVGSAYVLTPQKILQKQYEDSFNKNILTSLYGKGNYNCESKATNCDIGGDIKPKCEVCPYQNAFAIADRSPNVVFNYTLALLVFQYISCEKMFAPRKLMVFDECHTLEGYLTEFNAVSISSKRCIQFNVKWKEFGKQSEAIAWIKETYAPAVRAMRDKLMIQVEDINASASFGGNISKTDIEVVNKYKDVVRHFDKISEFLLLPEAQIHERYVFVPDKTYFKFKEVYGKNVFADLVKPMAEKFLFMSSTILDKDAFCSDLGLDPNETAFISTESEFPVEHRPILYMPQMKMTYGWNGPDKRQEQEDMINSIVSLCNDFHPDDNGIIHTGSFQVANWLIKNLKGKIRHNIMQHGEDSEYSRDAVIAEFQLPGGAPRLLISPSITEGLDLKDDKGRFAIIAKVPYPFLGDAWVKRRQELSKEWYSRQAMIGIIQGGGRVVRSKDDWGNVYILDASFEYLLSSMKNKVPKWWRDSIQTV